MKPETHIFFFLALAASHMGNTAVFLFSILGMGVGSCELGKFVCKVENQEKLSIKNTIPFSKHSQI